MSETTALTTTERAQVQTNLERDKMIREAAAAIAGQAWGKGLSRVEQAAVARYALEANLDPVRHVHVLGGTPYINADGYRETLADDPRFEGVEYTNITGDAAERENWGIPEWATAAYLCTVHYRGRRPTVEAGYAPKTMKKNAKGNYVDSIGVEFPHEKARTTATRRAAKNVVPIWSRRLERMETHIQSLYAQRRAIERQEAELPPERTPLALPADPYADAEPDEATLREVVSMAEMAEPVPVPDEDAYEDVPAREAEDGRDVSGDLTALADEAAPQKPAQAEGH